MPCFVFFFQAEDGIRDYKVTGVQTCALPICSRVIALMLPRGAQSRRLGGIWRLLQHIPAAGPESRAEGGESRSEEHTSELQSPCNLVCRLLLEKKKCAIRGS